MVRVVAVVFESCAVSARVRSHFDAPDSIDGLLYAAGIGRMTLEDLAARESDALGQVVTVEHVEAEILRTHAELAAKLLEVA